MNTIKTGAKFSKYLQILCIVILMYNLIYVPEGLYLPYYRPMYNIYLLWLQTTYVWNTNKNSEKREIKYQLRY